MLRGKTMGNHFMKICFFAVSAALLFGCSGSRQNTLEQTPDVAQTFNTEERNGAYIISPGDVLDIKFFYNPELNENVTVRPDGVISLQLIDEIKASGLTPSQLDEKLSEKYSKELRKPVITVIVRSFAGYNIYVGGEVARQGIYTLNTETSPFQAVLQAGGFLDTASPENTLLIRRGTDNQISHINVDLESMVGSGQSNAAQFFLQPYDIVYVPKSAIAEANKFVRQYVQDLILFRGWSFGINYDLTD
jgi:protein involved in polysaccharide export with SLBB domain